jgi:hypothetical protein
MRSSILRPHTSARGPLNVPQGTNFLDGGAVHSLPFSEVLRGTLNARKAGNFGSPECC